MYRLLALTLTALLLTSAAHAQTHRWHDLTPDSLKGATFRTVAVGYDGDQRVIYTSYFKRHNFSPTTGGTLKSTDSGSSWQYSPFYAEYLVTPPEHAHLVYALLYNALFKSTDSGQTWTDLTPALKATGERLIELTRVEISPHDTARVVVARSDGSGGLYLSDDGGATFRYVDLGFGSDGVTLNVVASPSIPGRLYVPVFRNGAFQSEDFFVLGD